MGIIVCEICNEDICEYCDAYVCDFCDQTCCSKHLEKCEKCDDTDLCPDCVEKHNSEEHTEGTE